MKYIKEGFRQTFRQIKKHSWLFIILILLQIIFLVSLSLLTITYQVKILESAKGVIEPLQEANFDPESIQAGQPFTKEMASIYTNYRSMMSNIKIFICSSSPNSKSLPTPAIPPYRPIVIVIFSSCIPLVFRCHYAVYCT